MTTAINGFRKCEIWPLNSNAYFLAAEITNINRDINLIKNEIVHPPYATENPEIIASTSHEIIKEAQPNLVNNNIATSSTSSHQLPPPYMSVNEVFPSSSFHQLPSTRYQSLDEDEEKNLPLSMLAMSHRGPLHKTAGKNSTTL
ncbi:unnamed protein product [Psylliodes chrysocephalus]|uniref:Uncharacterized protein n=1 Tax=Psylliodes chrysocephalus TaxID=3402493 RepID=A0A9P0CFT2_9CUCU|nr:unnamed protein product [Psylliodes chrysocephala]